MSYAVIVRKKIRMCARFGHLPESSRRVLRQLATYYCQRCGSALTRPRQKVKP